jgi:murein L,D-transpeptidase YcbB/YkuD
MERWKALPPDLGRFYIFVNTADFMLKVIKNDMVVMQMRVIVGRTYRRTPIFNSKLTHIILNPSWHIPPSIIKNDILPQIKKNKGYLQEKHIKIFYYDEKQKLTEVSGDSIDWNNISMKSFPYKLIQDPGEDNALGLVKFMFANDYNVYMHDTPSKELFNDSEPTFSSGCIRLSHALDLAMILLKNNTEWPIQKIIKTIGNGKTVTISLSEPVNIYIQYFTAWVNGEGMIQFRKDIYKRD